MNEVVGGIDYLKFVLALFLVLGLIGLCALLLRKYALRMTSPQGGRREKRLNVQEILPLDARNRLVLVRQDGKEHLLLLGHANSLVVDSAPVRGDTARGMESATGDASENASEDTLGNMTGSTGPEQAPKAPRTRFPMITGSAIQTFLRGGGNSRTGNS